MAFISETAGRRAKRSLIWDPWGISTHLYTTYAATIAFDPSRSCQGHEYENLENGLP